MSDIQIREAREGDFEFVATLMDDALKAYYDGDHRAHAERIFNTHISGGADRVGHFSAEQRMFILTDGEQSLGMINVVGKRQGTWKISPLIVAPEARGVKGCGSQLLAFALLVVALGAGCSNKQNPSPPTVPPPGATSVTDTVTPNETFGMRQYTDSKYGFSFWYPDVLQITPFTKEGEPFPGGTVVESMYVGAIDGPTIHVVDSPTGYITDEPANHASPISQTKYFYDVSAERWMVAYPEGVSDGSSAATTTADISKKTVGGLIMLPTGLRFDAAIIPLGTTRFLVISDGGTGQAPPLSKTVTLAGSSVDASALTAALKEEAAAYASP